MPAKTVLFTSVRKWDGTQTRWLTGGEYIQMSGRAGRRGIDDRGVVIMMLDAKIEPDIARGMVIGVSDTLNSAFHVTFTMLLNLLRVDGVTAETMLGSSFYQFQNTRRVPGLMADLEILRTRHDAVEVKDEDSVKEVWDVEVVLDGFDEDLRSVSNHPTFCVPFLQPGRLVRVSMPANDNETAVVKSKADVTDSSNLETGKPAEPVWGVILSFKKSFKKGGEDAGYIVDVLLPCNNEMMVIPTVLDCFHGLSSVRINVPKDLKPKSARDQIMNVLAEVQKRFPGGIPMLDHVADMNIRDPEFLKLIEVFNFN